MILPYLDYGDVLYAAATSKSLAKLQRIQNRCLTVLISEKESVY